MQKDEIIKRLREISDRNLENINGYTEENVKIHVIIKLLENEILAKEEEINKKYRDISDLENKVKSIKNKYPNIEELKRHVEYLEQKIKLEILEFMRINEQIFEFNKEIALLRNEIPSIRLNKIIKTPQSGNQIVTSSKKKKVNLSQLVQYSKIEEGVKLFFYERTRKKIYKDEYAFVAGDKIRYWRDNRLYSLSDLARRLRKGVGLTDTEQETQGPIYWITEKGKIIDELNNEVRDILYAHT